MQKVRKNIKNIGIILFVILNIFIFSQKAYTQGITIFTGKSKIALNEKFSVTISFPKDNKRDFKLYRQYFFPDIDDFEKGRTVYLEEEDPKGYKIIQYYKPRKAGTFEVNAFRIKVKDKFYTTNKLLVKVLSKNSIKPDPEIEVKIEEDLEFEESKLDVLLDLQATKANVFTGEGFGIVLSFLISTQNKAEFTYIDLAEQRKAFIKKIKPSNCFSEEVIIPNSIIIDTVIVKDKKYIRWKLYEGVFFPLDSNNIKIPEVELSVLSYSIAKNKQLSIERTSFVKQIKTKSIVVKVVKLPVNASKVQLPVGYFKLIEEASSLKFQTGKSFKYSFTIVGEGNIAALPPPLLLTNEKFDIYAPKVTQKISLQQGRVTGSKSFVYYVTPKEPGTFLLSDNLRWVYFNTLKNRIDTLTSSLSLKVRGESLKNNYISVNNPSDFYNRINTDSNELKELAKDNSMKLVANIFIIIMLISTVVLVFKK